MHLHFMRFAALLLAVTPTSHAAQQRVPPAIFTDLGLTTEQIAAIDAGRPAAKVLSWGDASEVYVFGAVHVKGSPETYLTAARDIERLSSAPGYRGVGEIRNDATAANLSGLALEPDDLEALEDCRDGACDVQLPTAAMQAFHDGVTWSQPDAAQRANALFRSMVLQVCFGWPSSISGAARSLAFIWKGLHISAPRKVLRAA